MGRSQDVVRALRSLDRRDLAPVIPFDLVSAQTTVVDLSETGRELSDVDLADTAAFTDAVFALIERRGAVVGIGRHEEDRVVYSSSPLFEGEGERRSVHMGIDLFVKAGTPVTAPLPATVHSFADNRAVGDYGPTIILEHTVQAVRFFTLYGHLTRASIAGLEPGRSFGAGETIARIGGEHENGGWPPHLHFQIIADMGDYRGDYPGVTTPSGRESFRERCPDPNLLLGIPGLSD